QGVNYRHLRRGERLGPYEYNISAELFVSFFRNRPPFSEEFDEALAREFYAEIRCGLLHEARTKGGWKVWAQAPDRSVVDRTRRIIYRNTFQNALDDLIRWYETRLPIDPALQEAFIRKFVYLCDEKSYTAMATPFELH